MKYDLKLMDEHRDALGEVGGVRRPGQHKCPETWNIVRCSTCSYLAETSYAEGLTGLMTLE